MKPCRLETNNEQRGHCSHHTQLHPLCPLCCLLVPAAVVLFIFPLLNAFLCTTGLLQALDPAAWRVAWLLLQDEDYDVREQAADLCSRMAPEPDTPTGTHPECLHAVQERVVHMLAAHARSQTGLLRCMLLWVCNPEAAPSVEPAAQKPSRLFEREKVNDYEEPLTAALCTARALNAIAGELSDACLEEVTLWQCAVQGCCSTETHDADGGAMFDLLTRVAQEPNRAWRCHIALAQHLGTVLRTGTG